MKVNPAAMFETLPSALIGWGGVFVVTIAIVAAITLLEKLAERIEKKD